MYAIRQGAWWQSPTWRFDLSPLLLYGIIVQFLQTFRRTQWSRGWMKVRRKGIKRSHRYKKSANFPNSRYLEHLPRHPSAIPLYRRSWTVRLLAATEEGAAEKKNKRQQCNLPPLYFFKHFFTYREDFTLPISIIKFSLIMIRIIRSIGNDNMVHEEQSHQLASLSYLLC